MKRAKTVCCRARAALVVGWLVCLQPSPGSAGTTGTIAGEVTDAQKRPVIAATVFIPGSPFGAFTNELGRYNILNVPAGTYEVQINRVGFKALTIRDVVVSADQTTRLDAVLEETAITTETVVVSAKRPPVDVRLTSSIARLQSEEIAKLPVQELQDVVNLQAGVVNGHFHGGRLGEVQYQVDGVTINNAFDNTASLRVDRSLLQEVQVITGTFDAEYGQAMSGVVNAVLKDGSEKFQAEAELFGGGFFFPGRADERLVDDEVQPTAVGNLTLSVSGPVGVPQTVFLVNARRYEFEDYVPAARIFLPAPSVAYRPDSTSYPIATVGDGEESPLGYSREWSGALKITNRSISNLKIGYQVLVNDIEGRRTDYAFRANPDGMVSQHTFSLAHGLDLTRNLGKSTYLDFSLRQNYFDYIDEAYEDVFDIRYDAAGPPDISDIEPGLVQWGVDFTRFHQTTNTVLFKSKLVSQVTPVQQLKLGLEMQFPKLQFGTPGHVVLTGAGLQRYVDEPPDWPGVQTYWPVLGAVFVHDQLEWRDFALRVGARLDYFDARSSLPSDLANPANAIPVPQQSVPVPTQPKVFLSPRLGVAYPITESAGVHFAYGHFVQFPTLRDVFTNADYSFLARVQASTSEFRHVMGNPDVDPEKSVQYEFGYKQALSEDFGFEVSLFYKDIRDLLGSEFINTYNDATYARLTNVDFGSVGGFTITLDHRRLGPASFALDYTWTRAIGNSSEPYETASRADVGEDPRPRVIPFDWDQRHTLNITLALAKPQVYSISTVLRAASGQPYTPETELGGFEFGVGENAARKPSGVVVDLRGERSFGWVGQRWGLFGRVFNVFDSRFFNGGVFADTGSPFYSRFPDQVELSAPTRFYSPRRVEIGFTVRMGL
ncbi:MAG TPA: TonB-dependent receptor [Candidatus Krumholzibacteria bacterium]|nr:TonB-dependent receptor [Candidatus Krumholzibacteria bacterium]